MWLDCATRNDILVVPSIIWLGPNPVWFKVPTTVSPTSKVPEIAAISSNFGIQYLVTSTPSKNAYTCVSGFNLVATNWILRDLINVIRSLLTTLSPREVLSNCEVTTVLVPVLVDIPVSITSRRLSWTTESVIKVPPPVRVDVCWFLVLVEFIIFCPVQLSIQEFQTVGANPVCGSTFKVLPVINKVSVKLPSTSITLGSSLTVSIQVSDAGVSSIDPLQKLTRKGVTLSALVPNIWLNHSTST